MRVLLLALLVSTSASAQPDPTPPARYYPLGVGDTWEYVFRSFNQTPLLERVTIERDSVVSGVRYAVQARSRYGDGPTAPPTSQSRSLVRFDDSTSRVAFPTAAGERFLTCPFDAPFDVRLDCVEGVGSNGEEDETQSNGGLGGTVEIGGIETPVEARKSFVEGFGDGGSNLYAAPIGFISNTGAFCEGCSTRLEYARIGGVEYGRPFTSSESAPATEARLGVFPNPARGRVTIALPAGAARLVVTDLLGREVMSLRARLGATEALDVSAWRAGVYVIRVDGRAPVRFTVVR